MFKAFFLILLCSYIFFEFYLNNFFPAGQGKTAIYKIVRESVIYSQVLAVILLPFLSAMVFRYWVVAVILFFMTEFLKYLYLQKERPLLKTARHHERNVYLLFQLLHIVCLFLLAYMFAKERNVLRVLPCIEDFFTVSGLSKMQILLWITALLLIHRPVNTVISVVLASYKSEEKKEETDYNAGRVIGTLERFIILILISLGQYSATALVLTAKSIARYDKISKEPAFAEYYLLGTLMSLVAVLVISLLIK